MEEKKWCVYKHTAPNGKVYIGITCHQENIIKRFGQNGEGYKTQRKFYRAIQKYGWDNFDHEILEKDLTSLDDANAREQYYIKLFDSHSNGYNSTDGGDGTLGRQYSDEERKIRSERMSGENNHMYGKTGELSPNYGVKFSEEHKRKIAEANIGKKISKETRDKLSKSQKERYKNKENHPMFGRKHRQESIDNMILHRRSYKGKDNPNYGKHCVSRKKVMQLTKTFEFVSFYDSILEASRITEIDNSGISKVCKGLQKTCGGYIWRYADEKGEYDGKDISLNELS